MSRIFNVIDAEDNLLFDNIPRKELIKLSQGLLNSSVDNRLGMSRASSSGKLIKSNKEYLIGSYAIEIYK